jgi:hypothetical protein
MSAALTVADALDPLLFDDIEQLADRAASYWRSIRRLEHAARRLPLPFICGKCDL